MQQISTDRLQEGDKIWYRYSSFETLAGPFKVTKLFSSQYGPTAKLKSSDEDRLLTLADDIDFGELLIFVDK